MGDSEWVQESNNGGKQSSKSKLIIYYNFTCTNFFFCIIKKIYIFCQFYFENFFVRNIYKFCYEKKLQEISVKFFCKIFCIKYFS